MLGLLAKKHPKIKNEMIPIQNLLIGVISAVIYYFITKDIDLVLASVPIFTDGTYDIINNLNKIIKEKKDQK